MSEIKEQEKTALKGGEFLVKETNCNDVFISLGNFDFKRSKNEKSNEIFRRSIYFVEDLEKGDTIQVRHIRRIRPGYGLPPKFFKKIIGSKVKVKVQKFLR